MEKNECSHTHLLSMHTVRGKRVKTFGWEHQPLTVRKAKNATALSHHY